MSVTLSRESIVGLSNEQVSCELSGEAVILHLGSGIYYGLDDVGARIWALLEEPRSLASLLDAMAAEYEVEPAVCEREVIAFLKQMADVGLVEIRAATFPTVS